MKRVVKTVPLSYIRGLIIAQNGRCAITGKPLLQNAVSPDHIVPLSRTDLSPSLGQTNIWLVHRLVNTMKCTMTYDELIECCHLILNHEPEARALLKRIKAGRISGISKKDFDTWADNQ